MTAKPIVFKRQRKRTYGRGFSSGELKKAESNLVEALKLHIAIDTKRRTAHDNNVETLKVLLKERKAAAELKKEKKKSKS
jgi:ribosomal protein L13E